MSHNYLGFIIGEEYSNFLSLDEYEEHFLLPFSPRFRIIDFAIGSLYSAGIKNIWIFCKKNKDIIFNYVTHYWPNNIFTVIDHLDLEESFDPLINVCFSENNIDDVIIINGSIPNWFDINEIIKNNNDNYILFMKQKNEVIYNSIILNKDIFKKISRSLLLDNNKCSNRFFKVKQEYNLIQKEIKGYVYSINSLKEYYDIHIQMLDDYLLLDHFNSYVPLQKDLIGSSIARISKDSYIKNSLVGNNVEINGYVENSIIFSDVKIQRGAYIKNSLIFPGNNIGGKVVIINSIIDEYSKDNTLPNIESHSKIGNENPASYNVNYPQILNFGVTLIGKDVRLPPHTEIESNCYIKSFTAYNKIKEIKKLRSGFSII